MNSNPTLTPKETPLKRIYKDKLRKRFGNCDAFCWSHTYTGSNAHTSSTCKTKLQVYQDALSNQGQHDGRQSTKLQGYYFKAATNFKAS
jgi:hypothetical protein